MALRINPYFTFAGTAREAFAFYQSVFGGELQLATFGDFHAPVEPDVEYMVMHGELRTEYFTLQGSDGAAIHKPENNATTNMEISILGEGTDLETAKDWFQKLSDGATNVQPLDQAPWGALFGFFTDKFGIAWMFNIQS